MRDKRCPLCGGVVVGGDATKVAPAVDHGDFICACSLADLRRALAEQSAGEAERVREAVARERERMGRALADAIELADEGWGYVDNYFRTKWDFAARIADLRARAASPAPEPAPPPEPGNTVADGWRERLAHAAEHCAHAWPVVRRDDLRAALREVAPAPEPVAAERAVVEAAVAWRDTDINGGDMGLSDALLIRAVDALAAARKGGNQ